MLQGSDSWVDVIRTRAFWRKWEWALENVRSRTGWEDGAGDVRHPVTQGFESRMTHQATTPQHSHACTYTGDQCIRK